MLGDILFLIGGLVLLYYGAEWLVGGSASLALRFGVSPLVAGLTVVAYGTSMPELVVSIKSAFSGQPGLALGNIVGSNLFNVGIILGLAALIQPIRVDLRVVRFDIPVMLAISVLFALMLQTAQLERWMGAVLVVLLVTYTVWQIRSSRRKHDPKIEEEFKDAVKPYAKSALADMFWVVIGIVVLSLGGRLLVDGGVGIARAIGVSETVIGLTIVAAGTSAPELAATLVAAFKKEADIAVGNIVGSNIFNILSVGGISSLIHPLDARSITHTDIYAMLLISALMLPLAWSGFVLKRWEGIVLLASYGIYFYLMWPGAS
jgi:cation:H+ antiporter